MDQPPSLHINDSGFVSLKRKKSASKTAASLRDHYGQRKKGNGAALVSLLIAVEESIGREALSAELGVQPATWSNLRSGKREFAEQTIDTLRRAGKILNLPTIKILVLAGAVPADTPDHLPSTLSKVFDHGVVDSGTDGARLLNYVAATLAAREGCESIESICERLKISRSSWGQYANHGKIKSANLPLMVRIAEQCNTSVGTILLASGHLERQDFASDQ